LPASINIGIINLAATFSSCLSRASHPDRRAIATGEPRSYGCGRDDRPSADAPCVCCCRPNGSFLVGAASQAMRFRVCSCSSFKRRSSACRVPVAALQLAGTSQIAGPDPGIAVVDVSRRATTARRLWVTPRSFTTGFIMDVAHALRLLADDRLSVRPSMGTVTT
jgi:hypothetical protein